MANAKADQCLTEAEESTLNWLIETLQPSSKTRGYLSHEISELRMLTAIQRGKLPSIQRLVGVEIKSGEIVHFNAGAIWSHSKARSNGIHTDQHSGSLTLTDHRVIFSSATRSQSWNYRKIIAHSGGQHRIDIQVEGKPLNTFRLVESSPIAYPIFAAAIGMAYQTKVAEVDGNPSRHIPREVRQRIWQKYGGRCAECESTSYLEFDHVIPVAKGGSNSDANVQLLCRGCNLKKSDFI